ncbi:MAG TPA: hypothetical protein VFS44_07835 [Gemmatimonadaceae bacterium]|nr:hypothetical protein [Gemmatimonadaceae bacterium]
MWSDTLLALERLHLERLAAWAGVSAILGTILLGVLVLRRARAPLVFHFAVQTALWGAAELLLAALRWRALAERDYAGAVRLAWSLRVAMGAEAICLIVGLTLAGVGWAITRRLATVGAGGAIVVQCAALLVLDASLLARIVLPG